MSASFCLFFLITAVFPGDPVTPVDFARDIRPIFTASCIKCHGPEKQEGDLRLDLKASALEGGLSGEVIEPGHAERSLLVRHVAAVDGTKPMPPRGPRLPDDQIQRIRDWINQGGVWPDGDPGLASSGKSKHWAYQPPVRVDLPRVNEPGWSKNPIDAFVLDRLNREGVPHAPEADRYRLIRRVSLDLTGLPPSVEEVDAFVHDTGPLAYEKVVDRLLASPHFGERWAKPWLDLARYADTHGFEKDPSRSIWPYRDWVINALNRDMPFDRFTIEQLAGDLLPNASRSQVIASGFHRNTMVNTEGGVDPEEARVATVVDRVNTTSTVWLGSTLACAQCHTHKFDPFTQREYYQFFAYFDSTDEPEVEVATLAEFARRDALRAQVKALVDESKAYQGAEASRLPAWEASLTIEVKQSFKIEVVTALELPPEMRNDAQKKLLVETYRANDEGLKQRQTLIAEIKGREPKFPTTMVLRERAQPRTTRIHIRGNFLNQGEPVKPGVPAVLPAIPEGETANRLSLARWLVRGDNPLTARVLVNRTWEQYFGRGLVTTVEDLGTQGDRPTHPELLDWLATELPRQGWSQKKLHRSIVTSATYRQSSVASKEQIARDPDNRLMARGPRQRVDAETIRDIALTASGLLARQVGGPSVFPPQPEGIWTMIYSNDRWVTSAGDQRHRRGLYTFWRRTAPYPAFMAFDAPSRETSCVRRPKSNTPIQALTTLNDPAFVEAAQGLARRIMLEGGADPRSRATRGFRLCVARPPSDRELDRIVALFEQTQGDYQANPQGAKQLAGDDAKEPVDLAAWTVVANVLLNLDETVTKE